ncbi:unnamed protein product [Polarella glacialis]|uniref:Uncharacterized protein n=1 Tax=Polarella glacialis TaxID=89957 RepID=A0A813DI06_POLGL|nr:unnamed protein product [Polarella glacialis]|mmetsp:Transcript_47769/g.77520  ORF Transcript_47769/g.77520 Transcript_47769/m.77520 type:complete len:147 (-) Transcript_47769:40-480(-)
MGKKRRRDEDEDENPVAAAGGGGGGGGVLRGADGGGVLRGGAAAVAARGDMLAAAARDENPGKKSKKSAAHVQDLKEDELEERSKAQAEELRKARFAQGQLRGEPPSSNRINWQREVTRMNNAVHRAEQAFNEVKREQEKRSRQKR